MTSRFWTICAIPFLPMGAAAVVLLMTLLGERARVSGTGHSLQSQVL